MATAENELGCGVKALYLLLRNDGVDVDLERLNSQMRGNTGEARSLQELLDASKTAGLRLKGVQIERDAPRPTSSAICYVNQGPHGHFVMIRPVGHTGALIQLFDGTMATQVMDWQNLKSTAGWTGVMLVRDRPSWPKKGIIGAFGGLGLVLIGAWALRARGKRDAGIRRKPEE